MTSPIDPARRAAMVRRAQKHDPASVDEVGEVGEVESANLPVIVETVRPAPRPTSAAGGATFAAQLLGQDGQKRGLKAGATVIDTARVSYNTVEYSGAHDRRARKGRHAKTEI